MIRCEGGQDVVGARTAVTGESFGVGATGGFQDLAQGQAAEGSEFRVFVIEMGDRDVVRPVFDGDELDDFVLRAFLVFLGLGVHVRRTDGDDRRAAVVDDVALFVQAFAQGFSQELDVPFGQGFQVVRIGHEDFQVAAVVLAGQEFEDAVEECRVLPDIRILAGVVHVAGAVEELADIEAREGTDDEADFGEDAETAADAIGNVEDGPARFLGQAVEERFLFAAVVRIRNGYRFQGDAGVVHGLFEDHVVGHGFDGRARFGNDDGHDRVVRFGMAVSLEEMDESRHLMGVDVVAGKEGFREALAFCRALEVPKFAALDVEEDLAAEIRTADAEEYDGVYAVARRPCQFFQGKDAFRAVDVAVFDVRQLREEDFFRFAVFREMARHDTGLAHIHNGFVGFCIDRRESLYFIFSYCIGTIEVGYVKSKSRT